ncbi:MAG: FAD-dependent oxidoreductase [Pseudomonadota bacterium]
MNRTRQLTALALVVLVVAVSLVYDPLQYLNLQHLKQSQAQLRAQLALHPGAFTAAYFALYVGVTALSYPGAALLTLAGGAVFGFGWGLLIVSFASSIGATLAFTLARFVLRGEIEKRFGARVAEFNRGIEKDGASYLFALRLLPLVPFFVINLVMGLTRMRARTFYWVSQLGMLPGTAVYVNAGTQLAGIDSLQGLLSPALIGSFVLLAVFPFLMRQAMEALRRRKVYARWRHARPRRFDRNIVVVGAGAGGLVTAYIAAAVKARVTLVEAGPMGGDCLHHGCVPSKALIRSAALAQQIRNADTWGLQAAEPRLRFADVMRRVETVIRTIEPHDSVERYTELGVEVLQGYATLRNPWTVEVALAGGGTRELTARSIVLATGADPVVPPLPGLQDAGYVTSDTLWARFAGYEAAPRRLVVLGGGPIGCELAQAFARLGSGVTVIEAGPRILPRDDADAAAVVLAALQAEGIEVLTERRALRCERGADGSAIVVQDGDAERRIPYDELICAIGRAPRVTGYGLEDLGLVKDRKVETDGYLRTLYPNIYAVGDLVGPYRFTHAASHQAWHAAVNALFGGLRRFKVDYSVLPWCTFTDPQVAQVGLTEAQAREQALPHEVTRFDLDELDRAIADGERSGFVKVLTAPGKDRILGVTIVGAHASEMLPEYVLAMKHGLGLNKILGTIHAYPTLGEANKYAAGAWKRAHQPHRLLEWVRRYHDRMRG